MNENTVIRLMQPEDVQGITDAFFPTDANKNLAQYTAYFAQQQAGRRQVLVALQGGQIAGYVTLVPEAKAGPFAGQGIPEIKDFNVLPGYRRQGIGSALMDAVEALAKAQCDTVSIGVGMHSGYGSAQRMYVKRGYIPDGTSLWYRDKLLPPGSQVFLDDDLILYFSKVL